jgi:hypothetical protein
MSKSNSAQAPNNGSNSNRVVPVVFLNPRGGDEFAADIGPTTTGQAAIDGLVTERFIPAPTQETTWALQLQRTGKSIPLSALLVEVGVIANDRIAVVASQSGA